MRTTNNIVNANSGANNNSSHFNNINVNSFANCGHNNNNNNNNNSHITASNNNMHSRPFPLRILVHSDVVGAIIGRSGSTIRNITQQTKARIDVHREESADQQEKVITISGLPENRSDACFRIIEVIQNEMNAKFGTAPDPNRDITLKILASSNFIGRLIGKNGASIKMMMEQTSTRINISSNSITESTGEDTIVVVGKLEQVRQAERLISAKLQAAYASDMNTSLHNMGQPPCLFNNVLLPYMPGPYSQNSIIASMVNPQAGHSGNSMPRAMALPTSHHGQMSNSMYTAPSYLPLYSNPSVPPGAPGLMGFNPVAPGFEQERETVHIYIPSTMVGAIIGKSGAAIKDMISTSGATIKVATAPHPSEPQRNDQSQEDLCTRAKVSDPEPIDLTIDEAAPNKGSPEESITSKGTPEESTQQLASTTSPRVSRYPSASNDPLTSRRVTIVGYPASQYSAQYLIYRKIAIESGKGDISLMVELSIPSQLVGRIIGKGGATVKSLQKQTRTTIRLPEYKSSQSQANASDSGKSETCVQITGEFEGSQAAQRQIKGMIRESLYSRPAKSQHYRNSESNTWRNNVQNNNNHQQSDNNGIVSGSCDDKLARPASKERTGEPTESCHMIEAEVGRT